MAGWLTDPVFQTGFLAEFGDRLTAGGIDFSGLDRADVFYAAFALMTVLLAGSALTGGRRRGAIAILRDAASFALLLAALAGGYRYREDLLALGGRVVAEIGTPVSFAHSDSQTDGERSVRIRRRFDGHFIARTQMNGQLLTMLVDTGASMVVLRPADAQKLGFNPAKLHYTVPVQTANGSTYAAPVRLQNVSVGPIHFTDVEALVAKPGTLRDSLLGMSFLNRLRSYEFSGDYLTLRI